MRSFFKRSGELLAAAIRHRKHPLIAAQLLLAYRRGEDSPEALAGAALEAAMLLSHFEER